MPKLPKLPGKLKFVKRTIGFAGDEVYEFFYDPQDKLYEGPENIVHWPIKLFWHGGYGG